jgi:hypothetical protein
MPVRGDLADRRGSHQEACAIRRQRFRRAASGRHSAAQAATAVMRLLIDTQLVLRSPPLLAQCGVGNLKLVTLDRALIGHRRALQL